jgi:hypothetical protein
MFQFNRITWVAGAVIAITQMSWAGVMPAQFNGGGSYSYDGWINLTVANFSEYGGFPGSGAWKDSIGSNAMGSGDSVLVRIAGAPTGGGPFPSDNSIYFGSYQQNTNVLGGTLGILELTPVLNLKTVVLQIQIGEAVGYDFYEPAGLPVLKVNGQTSAISASFEPVLLGSYQNGTYFSPVTEQDEPVYVNTWAFQWNLDPAVAIQPFQIEFSAVTHAQVYALQLDQTSVLQPQQVFASNQLPPQIKLVSVGLPESSGPATFVTHRFEGPADQTIDIRFSSNLVSSDWAEVIGVETGDGTFDVTFTASGDLRETWRRGMFFRAKHSNN